MPAMGKTAFMMYGLAVVCVILWELTGINALGKLAFGLVGGGLAIGAILLLDSVTRHKITYDGGRE